MTLPNDKHRCPRWRTGSSALGLSDKSAGMGYHFGSLDQRIGPDDQAMNTDPMGRCVSHSLGNTGPIRRRIDPWGFCVSGLTHTRHMPARNWASRSTMNITTGTPRSGARERKCSAEVPA